MIRSILNGPPALTEVVRWVAHGKLLWQALYADHPAQRLAARRAVSLLPALADDA